MTRTTNARLAGITFLAYIVTGIASMYLSGHITLGADGTAAKLASIAEHASLMRANILLTLVQAGYALVLGVTLYALTRDIDRDVAVMGLCCRMGEAVVAAVSTVRSLALLSIATGEAAASSDIAVAAVLFKTGGWTSLVAATCFAVGSTLFSYLFLRSRIVPAWLAWLGVVSSVLLVFAVPLQLVGVLKGPITGYMWMPMLVFEVVLAGWLIVRPVDQRIQLC